MVASTVRTRWAATVAAALLREHGAPQVLVLLAVFVLGLVLGVLLMVPKWWREHRQVRRSRTHPSPPNEAPNPKLNEADPHGV